MIETEDRDGVAVLRMKHGRANALDIEFCRGLVGEFRRIEAAPFSSVVLTGQGKIFSAGVDLFWITEEGPAYIREFLEGLHEFCETIFGFPKPVIAAIEGHAVAGGFILACMADRRIMARGEGRVGLPEKPREAPGPLVGVEVLRDEAERREAGREAAPRDGEEGAAREGPGEGVHTSQATAKTPTIGNIAITLLVTHPPHHLGQLRQWRRAAGIAEKA